MHVIARLIAFGFLICTWLPLASAADPDPAAPTGFAAEPAWVEMVLDEVQSALEANPPTYPPTAARVEALSVLDGPLHLRNANRFRSVHAFLLKRLTATITEIEATQVTTGAMVWKLYNHGFVVRTPTVTIGFDLVCGWREPGNGPLQFGLTPELKVRLMRQLDVLAVSHQHGDHADYAILEEAMAADVPVLADISVFEKAAPSPLLVRPPRLQPEVASDPSTSPAFLQVRTRRGTEIDYLAYPGHQAPVTTNNVFLLRTPDHLSFMHTGDQDWNPDIPWMENVARQHPVDLLLANCWSSNLNVMVVGAHPRLVVMGHENEMNHTPAHRETFWRSFQCFRPLPNQPFHVLCWGEGVPLPN